MQINVIKTNEVIETDQDISRLHVSTDGTTVDLFISLYDDYCCEVTKDLLDEHDPHGC